MKLHNLKTSVVGVVAATLTMFGLAAAPVSASAPYVLYPCDQGTGVYLWTCTTVVNGPVTVLDRSTGHNVTWQSGTNVALRHWDIDYYTQKCGVHGDLYVWQVSWNVTHRAVIGDYYLFTGQDTDWQNYNGATLYNLRQWTGHSGYCNDPSWNFT